MGHCHAASCTSCRVETHSVISWIFTTWCSGVPLVRSCRRQPTFAGHHQPLCGEEWSWLPCEADHHDLDDHDVSHIFSVSWSEVLERLQSELEGDCPINFQSPIADDVIHPKDILPNVFEGKFVSEVYRLLSILHWITFFNCSLIFIAR
jgi:hypothetical protein